MENILQPWVSWSFLQMNNHQTVKKMESIENQKYDKMQIKTVRILFVCGCKCVGVCICVYVL